MVQKHFIHNPLQNPPLCHLKVLKRFLLMLNTHGLAYYHLLVLSVEELGWGLRGRGGCYLPTV